MVLIYRLWRFEQQYHVRIVQTTYAQVVFQIYLPFAIYLMSGFPLFYSVLSICFTVQRLRIRPMTYIHIVPRTSSSHHSVEA